MKSKLRKTNRKTALEASEKNNFKHELGVKMLAASLSDGERFPGSTVSQTACVGRRISVFLRRAFHQKLFRSLKLKGRFAPISTLP